MLCDESKNPIKWEYGAAIETEETYFLCRCGHSSHKPFCDDTHLKIQFDGMETASNTNYIENAAQFVGPDLEYLDVKALCASARFCTRQGGVRRLTELPTSAESKEIAIQEIFDCPSGKLVAIDKKTGQMIEPELAPNIVIAQDPGREVSGPIWVKGGIPIHSKENGTYEVRNRVTLCRCGASKNKPFCDGSHIRAGFNDSV